MDAISELQLSGEHGLKMNTERWSRLMTAWGFAPNEEAYRSLVGAYSEKHRHYHTVEHINACLKHLDICAAQVHKPHEVELALWFHDAVYDPLSSKNEQKSSEWALAFLTANSATLNCIARVEQLIMATKHDMATQTRDESILVDIDLSILGADAGTYDAFEQAIRREYKIVPAFLYRKKRAEVLRDFLERAPLYQNEPFISEREQQAKRNLTKAISELTGHA